VGTSLDEQTFSLSPLSQRPGESHNLRTSDTRITAICQENAKLEISAEWKHATCIKNKLNIDCRPTSYDYIYQIPGIIRQDKYIMHNCAHNEFVGLRNRYLKHTPNKVTYNISIVNRVLDELVGLIKPHWTRKQTLEEFMDGKKGQLYKRYADAVRKINKSGFNLNKHSSTSAFVKNELYDEIKPPRMIINRDTRFNLAYGRYTTELEHCIVKIPQFSKGLNFMGRGKQFNDLVFDESCDILEGDCSKFEGTQRPELLAHIEIGIWKRLLDGPEYASILKLFAAKLLKRGFTQNGVKFSFFGCRGSGDMDTGLFNSILMWIACRYFEISNGFKWSGCFMVDGDDNVIKVPKGYTIKDTFAEFGFDAKLILRHDYHDVDYCSGKFIRLNNTSFMYIQNIIKIINNMSIFRKLKFNHCKADYFHSLGYMYKIIYGNIPIYKEFSEFLLRSTKGSHVKMEILKELNPMYDEVLRVSNADIEPSEAIRIELCMAFGLNNGIVEHIQNFYSSGYINFDGTERRKYRTRNTTRDKLEPMELLKCETLLD